MAIHMGGFGESQDAAGNTVNVAALADPLLFRSGDTLRVPLLNQVLGVATGVSSGGTGVATLVAPSLREIGNFVVTPINGNADADAEPNDPPAFVDMRDHPLVLDPGENMTATVNSNTSAVAFQWVLLLLSDGMAPVPPGERRTLRFTNTDTLVVDVWTNGDLTAAEELPAGSYAVIGMRAVSAGLVAARLVPRGSGFRPGCLGGDSESDLGHPIFRNGQLGSWMTFVHDNIPSVDFLSISTDSDQDVFLDLVKVS